MQILHVNFNKYPTKISLLLHNYIANEVMQFNELHLMKYMSHYTQSGHYNNSMGEC